MFPQAFQNYILILLMLVLGVLPIFNSGYNHPVVYPTGLALAIGVMVTVMVRWYRRPLPYSLVAGPAIRSRPLFPAGWFLLLFVAWAALGVVWSVDRYETLLGLNEFLLGGLIFFLAATSLARADAEKLVRFNVIIGTAIAVVGLLVFVFLQSNRVRSTFPHPNPFAAYAAMIAVTGLFLFLERRERWLIFPLVLIGDSIALSGSRGTWLAVLVAMLPVLARMPAGRRAATVKTVVWFLLLVVVTSMIITALAPVVQQHVAGLIEGSAIGRQIFESLILRPESLGSSSSGRLSFWGVAWRMARANPLVGVGLGNYDTAYFLFWPGDQNYSRFTHNYYLQTAAETGWPGLFFLLAFLVPFFGGIWRRGPQDYLSLGLLAGCLVFLAHSFIDFSWNFPATAAVFWAQAGMLAALQQARGQEAGAGGRPAAAVTGEAAAACASPTAGLLAVRGRFGQRLRQWINRGSCPGNLWFSNLLVLAMALWLAFSSSLFWLGDVLAGQARQAVARGDLEAGLTQVKQAVRLVPVAARYRSDLAWIYWQVAQSSGSELERRQAGEELERAVRLSPYHYSANLQLGEMLAAERHYREAEVFLRRAAVYGGFMPSPYADLGYLYLQQQRYEEVIDILQKGLKMADLAGLNAPTPEEKQRIFAARVQMHLSLARAYEELGNWPARRAELESVLELDPQNAVARRELGKHK